MSEKPASHEVIDIEMVLEDEEEKQLDFSPFYSAIPASLAVAPARRVDTKPSSPLTGPSPMVFDAMWDEGHPNDRSPMDLVADVVCREHRKRRVLVHWRLSLDRHCRRINQNLQRAVHHHRLHVLQLFWGAWLWRRDHRVVVKVLLSRADQFRSQRPLYFGWEAWRRWMRLRHQQRAGVEVLRIALMDTTREQAWRRWSRWTQRRQLARALKVSNTLRVAAEAWRNWRVCVCIGTQQRLLAMVMSPRWTVVAECCDASKEAVCRAVCFDRWWRLFQLRRFTRREEQLKRLEALRHCRETLWRRAVAWQQWERCTTASRLACRSEAVVAGRYWNCWRRWAAVERAGGLQAEAQQKRAAVLVWEQWRRKAVTRRRTREEKALSSSFFNRVQVNFYVREPLAHWKKRFQKRRRHACFEHLASAARQQLLQQLGYRRLLVHALSSRQMPPEVLQSAAAPPTDLTSGGEVRPSSQAVAPSSSVPEPCVHPSTPPHLRSRSLPWHSGGNGSHQLMERIRRLTPAIPLPAQTSPLMEPSEPTPSPATAPTSPDPAADVLKMPPPRCTSTRSNSLVSHIAQAVEPAPSVTSSRLPLPPRRRTHRSRRTKQAVTTARPEVQSDSKEPAPTSEPKPPSCVCDGLPSQSHAFSPSEGKTSEMRPEYGSTSQAVVPSNPLPTSSIYPAGVPPGYTEGVVGGTSQPAPMVTSLGYNSAPPPTAFPQPMMYYAPSVEQRQAVFSPHPLPPPFSFTSAPAYYPASLPAQWDATGYAASPPVKSMPTHVRPPRPPPVTLGPQNFTPRGLPPPSEHSVAMDTSLVVPASEEKAASTVYSPEALQRDGRRILNEYAILKRLATSEEEERKAIKAELGCLQELQQQRKSVSQTECGMEKEMVSAVKRKIELENRLAILKQRECKRLQMRAQVQQLVTLLEVSQDQSLSISMVEGLSGFK